MSKISIQNSATVLAAGLLIAVPALASAQRYDRRDRQEIQRDRNEIQRARRELQQDKRGLGGNPRDDRSYNANRDGRYNDDRRWDDRRQGSKNDWRNLGAVGGAVGVYGLLSGNKTLAALGLGGGLYSAYRYEEDRKSQNRFDHDRYDLYRRPSFDYQGQRYVRYERNQGGQRYYYFSRGR